MTIEDWTNQNYAKLLASAKNISYNNELSTELLHYSLEQLLFKPNLQAIINSGGAEFYLIRIMLSQWRSTTSPFYRIYRKNECQIDLDSYLDRNDVVDEPDEHTVDRTPEIEKIVSDLPWYDKKIWELYAIEGVTPTTLSRQSLIPRTSINLTISRVRNHIKQNLKP